MNHPICLPRSGVRLWLRFAAISSLFAGTAVMIAQVPEITNPADLHYLSVNTAFDPGDPVWKENAPMPTARAGFAISGAGGIIYAIGGAVLDTCTTVPTNEAYDPATNQWTAPGQLAPMPPPDRWRPSAGTLGGIIYVVGGEGAKDQCGAILDTVQAYDPSTDSWSDKTPVPTPRLQIGVGVDTDNNLLYAVGGAEADFTALDTVEVYDPTGNGGMGSWTAKQHLNIPRAFPAVAAIGGKIYAIGGQKEKYGTIDSVEEYNPTTNVWTLHTSESSKLPLPRLNSGAAVLNNKVYVVGGELVFVLASVEIYDPAQDSWSTGVPMPSGRSFVGVTQLNNILYAVGGEAPMATIGQAFTYQITATNNPTSYNATPLPRGLSVDRPRGIIFGVPTAFARGFPVQLTATNGDGTSDPKDVSFYILPPPSSLPNIVSSSCATGRVGQPFTFQVLTTNTSPLAQLTATGLPYQEGQPELTLDPGTGIISGTVTQIEGSVQSFGVNLTLTDGSATAQSFLQLTFVAPDSELPVINSASNGTLVLNQFFSYTITADATAMFKDYIGLDEMLDGSLPPGLSFDGGTGTISGIYRGGTPANPAHKSTPAGYVADDHSVKDSIGASDTIKKEPPPLIQLVASDVTNGTGTAPLNFFVSLRDFEIEALTNTTSEGTDYSIFTDDPLTSGGAAGLLKATKVGDYVTYTVPIAIAGTYDVSVGIKTNQGKGIFQLAIDGVNQGSPQDEYSPMVGYPPPIDLGPVTFATSGDKLFQFLVTGHNSQSSGYQLVFDYLDLIPRSEAESLPAQSSVSFETIHDGNLSGREGIRVDSAKKGDYVAFTVPVAVAGSYNVLAGIKTANDKGIFQLSIDGMKQGYRQDEYSSTIGYPAPLDLGTVQLAQGDREFKFSVTGRNPSSSGYTLAFDYFDLALATHFETESLQVQQNSAPHIVFNDTNLSGGKGTVLKARAVGKFVTYTVTVPLAGTYDIKVGVKTTNANGKFQLVIDDANQGLPQDEYSPKVGYQILDLGRITFTEAGDKAFRFLVIDKNPSSSGYQLDFDYIDLGR